MFRLYCSRQCGRVAIAALMFTLADPAVAEHPEISIANDIIVAKLYLPDANTGYYRGTRFDWSGVIHSLRYAGHEYFGEWQTSDDPYLNDRITGPVEEFSANTEIDEGETFFRIGVGVCIKPHRGEWPHPFRVLHPGSWRIDAGANWVEMEHQVADQHGQNSYRYVKRITLTPHKPELVIDHVLVNRGTHTISTDVYNHNFFVMDGQPTGPEFVIRFPFQPVADRDLKGLGTIVNTDFTYKREVPAGEYVFAMLTGFGRQTEHHQFAIENRTTKAGVRMVADRPMSKLRFWSPRTTLCPEPFVQLNLKPQQSDRWSLRYTFYILDD